MTPFESVDVEALTEDAVIVPGTDGHANERLPRW
jgi:hypothetical protein